MDNPFSSRAMPLGGPARDLVPVNADDAVGLGFTAVALYVETGGTLSVVTAAGETRSFTVGDFAILPVGVRQVMATGTTAVGIHAFRV
jgi:hypothetical protein